MAGRSRADSTAEQLDAPDLATGDQASVATTASQASVLAALAAEAAQAAAYLTPEIDHLIDELTRAFSLPVTVYRRERLAEALMRAIDARIAARHDKEGEEALNSGMGPAATSIAASPGQGRPDPA